MSNRATLAWSHREYDHGVGIFRALEVLARHGVPPTIAMDVLTAEHYPFLVRHCLGRGAEIMAHGISVSRMITTRMSDEEERDYIQGSVQRLTRATGLRGCPPGRPLTLATPRNTRRAVPAPLPNESRNSRTRVGDCRDLTISAHGRAPDTILMAVAIRTVGNQ